MAAHTSIALVFSYALDHCRGIMRGIREYARTRPEWMLSILSPDSGPLRDLRRIHPAGIIAHMYDWNHYRTLARLHCPLINVSGVLPQIPTPRVGLDDVAIGRVAAEHLLERGLRHFAYIGHPRHGFSTAREQGFAQRLATAGFGATVYHESGTQGFDPRGRLWAFDRQVQEFLARLPRPVGVFTCNDVWGMQAVEICRQIEVRVPDDIAIIGVDNDDLLCELARPSLSSVAVASEQVGYQAAALLAACLEGAPLPQAARLLPPIGVVTRQSSDLLAVDDADVAAALRFIRAQTHRPLTVADILEAVPVSRRSLERRFRKHTGRGLWEEIRRCHIARARELLIRTDLPMPAVAARAGFSDAKQLSEVFHQAAGETPTACRKRHRLGGN